jgi:hypothetical protein
MKKIVIIFAVVLMAAACSPGDFIRSRAESFVRSTYSDVDRILYYKVDTVTNRDNLNYRIEQAERTIRSYSTLGIGNVDNERKRLEAIRGLLDTIEPERLDDIAAFSCTIAYNSPSNLVWVQLDKVGNLLNITKDRNKVYLNPGYDLEEYYEVNDRFMK